MAVENHHVSYGKTHCKSISMAMFNGYLGRYQRVEYHKITWHHHFLGFPMFPMVSEGGCSVSQGIEGPPDWHFPGPSSGRLHIVALHGNGRLERLRDVDCRSRPIRLWYLDCDTGWWLTYPSEKYESQLEWLFPIYGKIKVMFQSPPTRT